MRACMAALVALAAPGLAHRGEQEGGQLVTGPTVVTWLGRVRGALGETKKGTKYFQFNRVPFAEPPVGTLRLRDPVPKLPWGLEVLDGTKDTPKCIQSDGFGQEPGGQEDCLFLTIYTPGLPSPSLALMGLRPVMLWIHGGAFVIGDGSGDPEFLLDDGVVFVSLQYRLGALGFLAVEGSSVLPGNLGLKDQQEAMRWVQRNIAAFGGDPRKVTLFGESAGAISVHAHVLSPGAHGLFRAGILHSGTALLTYERIIQRKTEKTGQDIVDKLGCGGTVDVLGCLQLLDQEAFLGVEAEVWIVQDSWAQRPVLPHNPLEQLVTGAFHRVPLINGITLHDGSVIWVDKPNLEAAFNARGNVSFSRSALGVALPAVTSTERLLTTQYFGRTWTGSLEENQDAITALHTDALFASPAGQVSTLHGRLAPVYNYILAARCNDFSFATLFGVPNITAGLVAHADDILCIFKPDGLDFQAQNQEQAMTSRAMTRAWTNFAKYLEPAPRLGSPGPAWPPGEAVMLLQPQSKLLADKPAGAQPYQAMADRVKLWDALYWREKVAELPRLARKTPRRLGLRGAWAWGRL